MSLLSRVASAVRGIPRAWRQAGLVAGGWLVCEVVARFAVPMPDARVLHDYFAPQGDSLLRLYDWFVGGALSSGSILALGVMPYFTARIYRAIAGLVNGRIASLERSVGGRRILSRYTIGMTAAFAVVQSVGYAFFTMAVGAVERPGLLYTAQVVTVLSGVSIFMGYLCQQVTEGEDAPALAHEPQRHILGAGVQGMAGASPRVATPVPSVSGGHRLG